MSFDLQSEQTLIEFLKSQFPRFRGGVLFAIARSIVIAPLPWLFALIIDHHIPAGDVGGVALTCVIFIGLLLMHTGFAIVAARIIGEAVTDVAADLRSLIFMRMQFLSFGYLDQNTTGRLLSKYAFDTQRVQDTTLFILNQIIPQLLYGLAVTVIMVVMNWQLSLFILFVLPVFFFSRSFFEKRLKARNQVARLAQEKLTGSANEMILALRLVRSLGEEERAETRLDGDNREVAEARVGVINVSAVFGTFVFVSNQAISIVVFSVGALMVLNGQMSIGALFAFLAALPVLMQPFMTISQFVEQYAVGQESFNSITELVACKYVDSWNGTTVPSTFRGEIEFSNVKFAYPTKPDTTILSDFSLKINAGESIALVGQSGSGKSTLANLILGLYPIQGGQICIDGHPQSDLHMRAFRRRCAIVMQDNILLSGSVLENIRFARQDATDEEVHSAARAANADSFIRGLPDGYNTQIGERGASLSGGQRQRISIARAILRNPQILILDEATSALDNESEALIQEALDKLSHGRTVITIAHRLSTIRNADRVVVMGEGRIVEQGTFDGLAKSGGAFSKLLDGHIRSSEI